MLTAALFESPLGAMACAWSGDGGRGSSLLRLTFGQDSLAAAWASLVEHLAEDGRDLDALEQVDERKLPPPAKSLVAQLRRFAEGRKVDFAFVRVDAAHLAGFARTVHDACRRVAYGSALSYGELAALAGSPRAARAVGNVMRQNRTPLIVPCHRIVAAGGKLGGYSSPFGLEMKRRLRDLEQAT